MITFHSIVRGFEGEFDLIQRNAIRSWLRLDPQPEIILFGDEEHEPGAVQAAIDIGLLLYDVDRNDRGVPLVRSPIESVRPIRPGIRCLVNADIILFQSFVEATRRVAKVFDEFLIISRRYKLDFGRELGFEPGWDRRLLEEARLKGRTLLLAEPRGTTGWCGKRSTSTCRWWTSRTSRCACIRTTTKSATVRRPRKIGLC
jgi:hypothetical protein